MESVGHASGRRILEILGKQEVELTEDDYQHMREVAGYVARHLKLAPRGARLLLPVQFVDASRIVLVGLVEASEEVVGLAAGDMGSGT